MRNKDNFNMFAIAALFVVLITLHTPLNSLAQYPEVNEQYINELLDEVRNWNRWGPDDELGTINHITNETRIKAASLVEIGESISLSRELPKQPGPLNPNPMEHNLQVVDFAGDTWAVDTYTMNYHGYAYSHLDALCHLFRDGKMYNGFAQSMAKPSGSERLGIQNLGNGILARGIIIDMPRLKGLKYLEPGTYITSDDLDSWEQQTGIQVGKGDVLLIRTGRWAKELEEGTWNYLELAAGLHPSVVSWMHKKEVAVLGSDGASERYPSGLESSQSPIHFLVIYGMGMPILDNLELEKLAAYADEIGRYEFMFTAAPLKIAGGTGSPLNPIATF